MRSATSDLESVMRRTTFGRRALVPIKWTPQRELYDVARAHYGFTLEEWPPYDDLA